VIRALLIATFSVAASVRGDHAPLPIERYDAALLEIRGHHARRAEADLRAALALAPHYALARFSLGTLLLGAGRMCEARSTFASAARDSHDLMLRAMALSFRDSIRR
jgi:hypothetical protein